MGKWIRRFWCDWTHGGGQIKRDMNDLINWQCSKCGRWSIGVDEKTERAITTKAISTYFPEKSPI